MYIYILTFLCVYGTILHVQMLYICCSLHAHSYVMVEKSPNGCPKHAPCFITDNAAFMKNISRRWKFVQILSYMQLAITMPRKMTSKPFSDVVYCAHFFCVGAGNLMKCQLSFSVCSNLPCSPQKRPPPRKWVPHPPKPRGEGVGGGRAPSLNPCPWE